MAQSRYAHPATVRRMTRNLVRLYSAACDADVAAGLAWYQTAHRGCRIWSEQTGVHHDTIAAVMAALSPQCEWLSNVRATFAVLRGDAIPQGAGNPLRTNVEKARRILTDGATSTVGYFKNGPKVRAFCSNLQGDSRAVTIDTHAAQAAINDVTMTPRVSSPSAYVAFVLAYQLAADTLFVKPCEAQAVVWLHWKRTYSPGRKRAIRRFGA